MFGIFLEWRFGGREIREIAYKLLRKESTEKVGAALCRSPHTKQVQVCVNFVPSYSQGRKHTEEYDRKQEKELSLIHI